jgi:hypothetical protein
VILKEVSVRERQVGIGCVGAIATSNSKMISPHQREGTPTWVIDEPCVSHKGGSNDEYEE